jgi:3-oxoacyl-[acyl-carrier protein] reductase
MTEPLLTSEKVLITGCSSDLGLALARHLLSSGRDLTVIAHSHSGGVRIEALVSEFGDKVYPIKADFSDPTSVSGMADEIAAKFTFPTQIIHLPALRLKYERLTKFNLDHFRRDMAIQVESIVILLQRFAAKMSKSEAARIVFVTSSVTHGMPPRYMSMYTVIKYAQLGLMRAAAAEYSSSKLTVNAVSPSMIETQFLEEIGDVAVRTAAAANPQGRNATPADVVGAIEFLLSPAAGYMTGVDLPVTAGSSC